MPANAALLPKEMELAKLEGQTNRRKLWNLLKAIGTLLSASVAASTAITGATETATAFSTSYALDATVWQ